MNEKDPTLIRPWFQSGIVQKLFPNRSSWDTNSRTLVTFAKVHARNLQPD